MALHLQGAANQTHNPVFAQLPVPVMTAGRSVAATTTSTAIPLSAGANTVIITNTTDQILYCKFGNASVTVNMGDLGWQFIVAGTDRRAMGVPSDATHIALIATAPITVYLEQY